jgi:hypothetical protein
VVRERRDELEAIATRLGDPGMILESSISSLFFSLLAGVPDVPARLAHLRSLTTELRQPRARYFAMIFESMWAAAEGRFDEADAIAAGALELGQSIGEPDVLVWYMGEAFISRRFQGRLRELGGLVDAGGALAGAIPAFDVGIAELRATEGDHDAALRVLEELARDDFARLRNDPLAPLGLVLHALSAKALDVSAHADRLHELLEPWTGQCCSFGAIWLGPVDYALGELDALRGRLDEACGHFAVAAEVNERLGTRPFLAAVQLEWARVLLARDAPGDRERADEMIDSARRTAAELNLDLVALAPWLAQSTA